MIAGVLFCGILALLSCSCVSDVYDDGGSVGELVTLVLKAAVLDSGEQDDQLGEDLMNSLRIVILSRNRNGYWSVVQIGHQMDFLRIWINLPNLYSIKPASINGHYICCPFPTLQLLIVC